MKDVVNQCLEFGWFIDPRVLRTALCSARLTLGPEDRRRGTEAAVSDSGLAKSSCIGLQVQVFRHLLWVPVQRSIELI